MFGHALYQFLLAALFVSKLYADEVAVQSLNFSTATTAIDKEFSYHVENGKIWRKSNLVSGTPWQIWGKNGLPYDIRKNRDFNEEIKVKSLLADGGVVIAISEQNRVYTYECMKGYNWSDKWGSPTKKPLIIPDKVKAIAFARRDHENIGYFEDPVGNKIKAGFEVKDLFSGQPTKYGTMHIFLLSEDGTEINYADPGLTASFGYRFSTPLRGKFVSDNIAASGSTLFVIGERGRMFTRMVDFESNGNNPMVFDYTYKKIISKRDLNSTSSLYGLINLPAETWREQPQIKLLDNAMITKKIAIITTGFGNSERELRVQGKNEQGDNGFYYKKIYEGEWQFKVDSNEVINEKDLFSKYDERKRPSIPKDIHLRGGIQFQDKFYQAEIVDFNLADSPAMINMKVGDNIIRMKLHTVDTWSILEPNDPGRDGTLKLFWGTIELDDISDIEDPIYNELKKFNLEAFKFFVYATEEQVQVKCRDMLGNFKMLFAKNYNPLRPLEKNINTFYYILEDDEIDARNINLLDSNADEQINIMIKKISTMIKRLQDLKLELIIKRDLMSLSLAPLIFTDLFTSITQIKTIEQIGTIPSFVNLLSYGPPLFFEQTGILWDVVSNCENTIRELERRLFFLKMRSSDLSRSKITSYLKEIFPDNTVVATDLLAQPNVSFAFLDLAAISEGTEHFTLYYKKLKLYVYIANLDEELLGPRFVSNNKIKHHVTIVPDLSDGIEIPSDEYDQLKSIFKDRDYIVGNLTVDHNDVELYDTEDTLFIKNRIDLKWQIR